MTTARRIDRDRGERIKFVRTEILNLKSQEQFASLLSKEAKNVTRGAVGNWEQGKEVGIESLTAICRVSGVNLDWLAYNRGEVRGPMQNHLVSTYDPDEPEIEPQDEFPNFSREHWKPATDGAIPEIDAKLGAGNGIIGDIISLPVGTGTISGHRVVGEWLFPTEFLRNEAKASPTQSFVMEIVGDSMQPTYVPGDRVIVDLSQNRMTSDTVYAISDGHSEPQIKRLQRIPFSDPPQVIIISDNPNLQSFTVDLDRLTIIGRICGHVARK